MAQPAPLGSSTRPFAIAKGFKFAGVYCGIKRTADRQDLTLVVSETDAVAAGVYTQNLVFAAPVALDRQRTPGNRIRGVVINSGNANACTGDRGYEDARQMARQAAQAIGAADEQVLVMSTGIIGSFLPLEKITAGIQAAAGRLGNDEASLKSAALGIMTTDTVPKIASRVLELPGRTIQLTGLAKGAAMIGPNMATMLSVIMTDASLEVSAAQSMLAAAVNDSFNCLSVEGHMSTNDTVLLLANGAAGGSALQGEERTAFEAALGEVCIALAQAIADDAEGATHVITLHVDGCATREAARQIAKTVGNSPLVKTAIAGADPNWGRIVSAAGYAGVPFDPAGVTLEVQGTLLYRGGVPLAFDAAVVSASIRDHRQVAVRLHFSEGQAGVRFWTTDLTAEYVRLNADYHT